MSFRHCSMQCYFVRYFQCHSIHISNTKCIFKSTFFSNNRPSTFFKSDFSPKTQALCMCVYGFHNIFMKNITTYLNYDSHWQILINLTWLREPSYFLIKQCCFLLAGWILSRLCPSVELISTQSLLPCIFCSPRTAQRWLHKLGRRDTRDGRTLEVTVLAATGELAPERLASSLLSRCAQSDPGGPGGPTTDSCRSTLSCSAVGMGTCFITARVLFVIRQNYK